MFGNRQTETQADYSNPPLYLCGRGLIIVLDNYNHTSSIYNYCYTFINCIVILHHLISQCLPVMHMERKQNFTPDPIAYNAPMYKRGAHAGVRSITGDL